MKKKRRATRLLARGDETASYIAPFLVDGCKSETYFYVRPAGRVPESTLGYFAPSRLPAMLGQQPVELSSVLMNFKPFVCDQIDILPATEQLYRYSLSIFDRA